MAWQNLASNNLMLANLPSLESISFQISKAVEFRTLVVAELQYAKSFCTEQTLKPTLILVGNAENF